MINLTNVPASPEQTQAGLLDLPREEMVELHVALTFDATPSQEEIQTRARKIARLTRVFPDEDEALVGGPLFLVGQLEQELWSEGVRPCFAFGPDFIKL